MADTPDTPHRTDRADRTETSQYFASEPSAASDPVTAALTLPDLRLDLASDRGVFARGRIDAGTKLLLLDGPAPVDGDRHLVDLGAGYGPIAVTLATRNPSATVWAVEVNERARELCRENAASAGLANVEVVAPDAVPPGLVVDRLWSNPPIRIGKPALRSLLAGWLGRLGPTGSAHLVVQKHLGADSLQRWLTDQGWPTTRRGSRGGYRLLDVESAVASAAAPSAEEIDR
ncbi:MAG: methyltransferase [Actinomycetota bacterium]